MCRAAASASAALPFLVPLALVALPGCGNRFEVGEGERRPDAAVETFPPAPVCRSEPRQVGTALADGAGRPAARLVRWRDRALLVRVAAGSASEPARVVVERVERDGAVAREGETTETGAPGLVAGLGAVAAGGSLRVAITRDDGRVDLLALSVDGAADVPLRSLALDARRPARVLWYRGEPLLEVSGRVHRPDAPTPAAEPQPDAGPEAAPSLPSGEIDTVVAAGEGLGWIYRDEAGMWLGHQGSSESPLRTLRLAASPGAPPVRLLWAGDRYLVADESITTLSRYVIPERPRRGEEAPTLTLGGRFVVPRPPGEVALAAWDNSGPRHVGVAQALGPRHVRFLNLALAGQVLDAESHLRSERDLTSLEVLWDGQAYVLLYAEGEGERGARLTLVRFSCPDDG